MKAALILIDFQGLMELEEGNKILNRAHKLLILAQDSSFPVVFTPHFPPGAKCDEHADVIAKYCRRKILKMLKDVDAVYVAGRLDNPCIGNLLNAAKAQKVQVILISDCTTKIPKDAELKKLKSSLVASTLKA